jgi:hypothetical protein
MATKIELRVRNAPSYELGIVRYTIYKPTNCNSITYFEYVPIALLLISCTSTYIHTASSMTMKGVSILITASFILLCCQNGCGIWTTVTPPCCKKLDKDDVTRLMTQDRSEVINNKLGWFYRFNKEKHGN